MKGITHGLIIGISVGVILGVVLAILVLSCVRHGRRRRRCKMVDKNNSRRSATFPICVNGVDSAMVPSDSTIAQESPRTSEWSNMPMWLEGLKRKNVVSACGIPKYSYKDLQKATEDFTTVIGQGAFGPVYKARMETGEILAVKVLATNSKQGEMEFLTEVLLLAKLHHRNLVNLVGFSAEKGHHMLVYVYMSNGSVASHLYSRRQEPLSWDLRIHIALDVARGLEYLHYGAVPPIVHRDIKSSNILLDQSMRARVSDFGLSRQEVISSRSSNVRGTIGYLDPEYMSTRTFTKKSDIYSFGVLLFELITGIDPQKGLMEYVKLAAMDMEGKVGWEEIIDSSLNGNFDAQELNHMATLAYKCISHLSRKRPSMRDIVQTLSQILKMQSKHQKHHMAADELLIEVNPQETDARTSTECQ